MTPERWKRTEELYHAARALSPGERAAFLAEACPDDDALRRDVESLLNEPASDGGFLAEPALVTPAHAISDLAPATMTGRSLGGYHLQALLGAGGMGEVYRARDAKLGRDVAIKILPRAFTSDPDRLARFEREARMLAALNHPNVCAIYGLEEAAPSAGSGEAHPADSSVRFLILELVEGDTLARRLADDARPQSRGAGLPVREALTIARQIAEALEVAHEKGIVHRDLKPANIIITPDGVVKVLDFGLAKSVGGESSSPDLTHAPEATRSFGREGPVMGTAAYMSPEQARGLAIDKRTDIWAYGCVLYEMLTGRVTFAGDTISDSIAKILEREPDWSALPPTTPAAIRRLLFRCLVKDPKKRVRDIGDVRIEIDAIDEVLPGAAERTAPAPQRWRSAVGAAIVVISLATAIASWLARGTSAAPVVDNLLANAKFTPFTNFEGSELDATISPDGKFVAFMADVDGPFHAWLKQIGSGSFVDLTRGKEDQRNVGPNRSVGFSGDGSEVWINGTAGRRLAIMPLMGGAPRAFLNEKAVNVVWSADGTKLAYFTYDAGDPIFVADRTGGNPQQLYVGKNGDHHHFPAWSIDGRWIYFAHGNQAVSEFDIWRLPSSGGKPEPLLDVKSDVRYVTPIDARTVLYVAPEQDGSGPWLWALDVERRVTRRVSIGLERYLSVAASTDGRRLVATVSKSTATLWSVPILDRLAEERDVRPYPTPTVRALGPRFGNASLFYLSSNGPGDGLWRLQDGKAVEIWRGAEEALLVPPAVSPRGDQVAVVLRKQGKLQLTVMSADGADHRSLTELVDVRGTPAWSPDAKWIVTGGNDADGQGLFKIPVDGGAPLRLVTGPALYPAWSPDGNVIVYAGQQTANAPLQAIRPDRTRVSLPDIRVPGGVGGRPSFLPDGTLVYLQGPVRTQSFWMLDLTTGKTRELARLSNPATTSGFDVTPDGRQIVFDRVRELSDVRLIDLPK